MNKPLVLLTGSSGFIGTSVIRALEGERIPTISLSRQKNGPHWDPYAPTPMADPQQLAGVTAAIHLSGANLSGQRWTPAFKREIVESRIKPTHALSVLLAGLRPKPSVMVCASAIGIYGGRGDELLTESSQPGTGFLPETCVAWEEATRPAEDAGIRVVHARFGVVLSPAGGALKEMLPLFRLGLGGRLGNGRQWLSWVTLEDACRALLFALEQESLAGPMNVVSPQPVTNREFTRQLGHVLHRPTLLPAPAAALKLVFGEMAGATILESERVLPTRLQAAGFSFNSPDLATGLKSIL